MKLQVDANDLLAVPPGAENAEMTPRDRESACLMKMSIGTIVPLK